MIQDNAILNNTTTVTLAKFLTPITTDSSNYTLRFNNKLFNPHSGHNSDAGGIVSSTGFFISNWNYRIFL